MQPYYCLHIIALYSYWQWYILSKKKKKKSCAVLLKGSNLLSIGITEKSLFAL